MKPQPYYDNAGITLYRGDSGVVLKDMPDGSIDLTVTSPPYDNLRTYNGFEWNFETIAAQLYRVTKPGGVVVWVVGDATVNGSETGTSFRQALHFKELGFNLHDTMIYEKNGASYPAINRYYDTWEYMFVLSKGIPATANLLSDRKNLWGGSWGNKSRRDVKGELKQGTACKEESHGVRFNIWRYNTGAGFSAENKIAHEHPAVFPLKLANDHIKSWSNEGDTVLDCFAGSGTVGVGCVCLKRRFIGVEISETYCALAARRIAEAQSQCQLDFA